MANKLFFPACFTSAVALAACVAYEPVRPAPQAEVISSAPLRAGYATVRSITPLSDGSTRLTLAMRDNSIQQVDTRAAVRVGEGVEITMEGYIRYPIPPQAMRNRY